LEIYNTVFVTVNVPFLPIRQALMVNQRSFKNQKSLVINAPLVRRHVY